MQSVKSDLGFIGMVIADEVTNPDWYSFTVGNQSIQFAHITFFNQRITIRANGKTYRTIEYRGSLEKFGEDVCTKIVKLALKKNL